MKRWLVVVLIIMAVGGIGVLVARNSSQQPAVKVGTTRIPVEIADTDQERQRGLGHRDKLDPERGMLFVFEHPGDYGFWMKDTRFTLDIIWISADKKIVTIADSVEPETYPKSFHSELPAQYVLEVNGGFAKRYQIKVGDAADFQHLR